MKKSMKVSRTSIALLVIQLALVSTVAGKYLYQRWKCPRVWTRASVYDPMLLMRGRYLSLQLTVDGCRSTLPSARQAQFPRNVDGTTRPDGFAITPAQVVRFPASLKVEGNRLLAIRLQNPRNSSDGLTVQAEPGTRCETMRLESPVNFYIAEHAATPTALKPGQELWIEVTVPPSGPPRPIQLALKDGGAWKPLAFQ
jgi:hypothetical protein